MRLSYVTARNGVTYVYKGFKTWDKERGKYRTKRKCIGKLDPKTGKLIPSTRQNKSERAVHQMIKDGLSTHMVGHDLLLSHVTKHLVGAYSAHSNIAGLAADSCDGVSSVMEQNRSVRSTHGANTKLLTQAN